MNDLAKANTYLADNFMKLNGLQQRSVKSFAKYLDKLPKPTVSSWGGGKILVKRQTVNLGSIPNVSSRKQFIDENRNIVDRSGNVLGSPRGGSKVVITNVGSECICKSNPAFGGGRSRYETNPNCPVHGSQPNVSKEEKWGKSEQEMVAEGLYEMVINTKRKQAIEILSLNLPPKGLSKTEYCFCGKPVLIQGENGCKKHHEPTPNNTEEGYAESTYQQFKQGHKPSVDCKCGCGLCC